MPRNVAATLDSHPRGQSLLLRNIVERDGGKDAERERTGRRLEISRFYRLETVEMIREGCFSTGLGTKGLSIVDVREREQGKHKERWEKSTASSGKAEWRWQDAYRGTTYHEIDGLGGAQHANRIQRGRSGAGAFKDLLSVVNVPSIGGRTLELDIRRKWCELRHPESAVLRDVTNVAPVGMKLLAPQFTVEMLHLRAGLHSTVKALFINEVAISGSCIRLHDIVKMLLLAHC
ncbi:hypothetical protein B0H13DRAFT_1851584 [Mycena leptocephala]|nr:hypothetical protein B0H13DRAFT_1851584 [Mycena leptocephala]